MAKNEEEKVTLLGCDNVESARAIIEADKNTARKKAFSDAYERTKLIVPEFFIKQQRKPKNTSSSSGGKGFSQNIIVTPQNVKLETKGLDENIRAEEKERED